MTEDNLSYFQNRMAIIETLLEFECEDLETMVKGMSFFITAKNHAYYYNESFLNNYLKIFVNFLGLFRTRKKQADKLAKSLSDVSLEAEGLEIYMDNIWQINLSSDPASYKKDGDLNYLKEETIIIETVYGINEQRNSQVYKFPSDQDIAEIKNELIEPYSEEVEK